MRLPADVVCVSSVKSESECSLTQCARLCLSVCGRSARSPALSDTEGASIGAASDRSDWKDFNNGHPRQRQTNRQRKRAMQS